MAERGLGRGEVDDDVGVAEHLGELDPERRVGPAGQLHVLGALDRLADGLAHPPGGAGDGDPDHAATRALADRRQRRRGSAPRRRRRRRPRAARRRRARPPARSGPRPSTASTLASISSRLSIGRSKSVAREIRVIRAAVDSEERTRRPLTLSLARVELLVGDRLGAQPRELGADDRAGLLDVVLAGADVGGDQARVGVLLVVGADRVGEAALLAHLAEQPRGGRAAEDRVEHGERVAALVVAGDPGRAEADVVLLGVLLVEAEPGVAVERRRRRRRRRRSAARRDQPLGELDDPLVVEVAGGADDDVRRRCSGRGGRPRCRGPGSRRSPRPRRAPGGPAGARRRPPRRGRRGRGPAARPRTSRSPRARPRARSRSRDRSAPSSISASRSKTSSVCSSRKRACRWVVSLPVAALTEAPSPSKRSEISIAE